MSYKHTKIWTVDKNIEREECSTSIEEAALWIKGGELVAFPTETVYGLGANALSQEAVAKIFLAKGRPSDNPLIVHISRLEQLEGLVIDVSEDARKLMDAFWPGALTLILSASDQVATNVTAGLSTVAVRMPSHPVALTLLDACGVPVAAPSANLSGKPSPTTATHVQRDLDKRIAGIVDGGPTGIGVESTVLDLSLPEPVLYRPGGVTREEIEAIVGPISVDPALTDTDSSPRSPGMKYTHYAPKGTLTLVRETKKIRELVEADRRSGLRVGVLATRGERAVYEADVVVYGKDSRHVAHSLYDSLRRFDDAEVDVIYAETLPEEGIGMAVMNRLRKAAGGRIL
ncbi:L-threonylcarbamoyladenylate synthase [Shouchella shacheensis]|uniref:L-threonylcarbamoyladenylate synthase n=1 Tax=Shouchella shacheensis TaxID=1649580 RepID=UPI0007404299|nr:L-threonylcarbamoyladenylate synthase [Shouchella shacheensis]